MIKKEEAKNLLSREKELIDKVGYKTIYSLLFSKLAKYNLEMLTKIMQEIYEEVKKES